MMLRSDRIGGQDQDQDPDRSGQAEIRAKNGNGLDGTLSLTTQSFRLCSDGKLLTRTMSDVAETIVVLVVLFI